MVSAACMMACIQLNQLGLPREYSGRKRSDAIVVKVPEQVINYINHHNDK
jgi:hypothetical protein